MKAYTDLEQSKKLSEFLPLKSADMRYTPFGDTHPWVWTDTFIEKDATPCWSLAALLDYLSANFRVNIKYLDNYWELDCHVQVTYNKELVDACVEMILKLHELNLL